MVYTCDYTSSDVILCEQTEKYLKMYAVAEIKSREKAGDQDLTLEYLQKGGGYLISHSKIEHGKKLSELHRVPFLVVVSLMKDDYILIWQLTNGDGDYVIKNLEMRSSVTRATCNGGMATRINAYLPMSTPHLTIHGKPKQDDGRDS